MQPKTGWIQALDAELVSAHIGVAEAAESYESAKAKLGALIKWHIEVATDPAVNGGLSLQPVGLGEALDILKEMVQDRNCESCAVLKDYGAEPCISCNSGQSRWIPNQLAAKAFSLIEKIEGKEFFWKDI